MIWAALACLPALVGAWYVPVTIDEAWSLVVARRMVRGDRLYRDIFYGAAPLAIWIQALAFRVLRPQGLVVRALSVSYFAAAVWAAATLVGGGSVAFAASATMLALGGVHLFPPTHYGHLSSVATLWSAVAVIDGRPWLAGLLVGAAVLGRYSAGLVAVVAMAAAAAIVGTPSDGLVVAGAAMLPVVLLPIARPSAAAWFYRRAVANKRIYLDAGKRSAMAWFREQRWSTWETIAVDSAMAVAIVLAAVAPVVAGWRAITDPSDVAVVGVALTAIALSTLYPRFDGPHAAGAALLFVPGLAMTIELGAFAPWAGAIAALVAVIGIAGTARLTRRATTRRDLPSLRHLPVLPLHPGVWPDETADLPAGVFVLRVDAAFVYACGGLRNPTPFDFPAKTVFGPFGQAEVIRQFDAGMPICLYFNAKSPQAPAELLARLPATGGYGVRLGRLVKAGDTATP
jgi:hypothetical protein